MKINELEPGKKFTLDASDEERRLQLKGKIANVTAEKDLALIKQVRNNFRDSFFVLRILSEIQISYLTLRARKSRVI